MAAPVKNVVPSAPKWIDAIRRWYYPRMYFPQLGLMRHDVLYENKDVKAAIEMLPKDVYDARVHRINRAMILSASKSVLPKQEWTKFEDDELYLTPYLNEVKRAKAEKKFWARK